jgi:hypothetical protein
MLLCCFSRVEPSSRFGKVWAAGALKRTCVAPGARFFNAEHLINFPVLLASSLSKDSQRSGHYVLMG